MSVNKPKLEVCLTPALFPLIKEANHTFVIIDVFRASTTICAALSNGVSEMRTIADREEARCYQSKGYLVGGERLGKRVEGFDMGNSPYDYIDQDRTGKKVVLSTTNGSKIVEQAEKAGASQVLIGCFNNYSALVSHLTKNNNNVLLYCAGWRDTFSLEDAVFAGAMVGALGKNGWDCETDSAFTVHELYRSAESDIHEYLKQSAHYKRLSQFGLNKDLEYACRIDNAKCVPQVKNGLITDLH